jgi:hypothetical protein
MILLVAQRHKMALNINQMDWTRVSPRWSHATIGQIIVARYTRFSIPGQPT